MMKLEELRRDELIDDTECNKFELEGVNSYINKACQEQIGMQQVWFHALGKREETKTSLSAVKKMINL